MALPTKHTFNPTRFDFTNTPLNANIVDHTNTQQHYPTLPVDYFSRIEPLDPESLISILVLRLCHTQSVSPRKLMLPSDSRLNVLSQPLRRFWLPKTYDSHQKEFLCSTLIAVDIPNKKKLLWIRELDFNEINSIACVRKHLPGMFPILMCSFDFISVWFSWTLLTLYYTAGLKRNLTTLNNAKEAHY